MRNSITKKVLFVGGVVVALVVITILFLLVSSLKKTPEVPPPKPITDTTEVKSETVLNVSPDVSDLIFPGAPQEFTVSVTQDADPSLLKISLFSSSPSTPTDRTSVPINTAVFGATITTTTQTPLTPATLYTLELYYEDSLILRKSYLTSHTQPTQIPTNNQSLANFLPYSESSFSLEYNDEKNLYVMHFKYDASSSVDLEAQLEEAKQDTINFIRSKNINPDTIIIEYSLK